MEMQQTKAVRIFEALSSAVRLDIFRLLVKNHPDGLVAGRIASELDIPANNLSFHLKNLTHAVLVTVEQEGRFQRYKANIEEMHAVIKYLTEECACNNKESCTELREKSGIPPNILPRR